MANLVQTTANVAVGSSLTRIEILQVGEAVVEGQPLYRKASDGKYYKADANLSTEAAAAKVIALTPASTDGYVVAAKSGPVNLGATLAVGVTYVVSATAGAICPIADLVTGDRVTILGTASSTSLLELSIDATGITKA